jgi:hypothetical protein
MKRITSNITVLVCGASGILALMAVDCDLGTVKRVSYEAIGELSKLLRGKHFYFMSDARDFISSGGHSCFFSLIHADESNSRRTL